MTHRHDKSEYPKRKAARAKAAAAHGGNASVKDRLDTVEEAIGLAPVAP